MARSPLADAHESRDWRIYADFAQGLIRTARQLYVHDAFGIERDQTVYALDATTLDLCLALFPWACFRQHQAAVKLHTRRDRRGRIPTFIRLTPGRVHEVSRLDQIVPGPGAFYVIDRGYIDFTRRYALARPAAFFVTRAKQNLHFERRGSQPIDKSPGLRSDQTIVLTGV